MNHKNKKPGKQNSKEDRKKDYDLALFDRLQDEVPELLNQSDAKIAADCEEMFGISAEDILSQFKREDEMDFTTVELIMMAHEPHFFQN